MYYRTQKIWSQVDSYNFAFVFYPSFEKSLEKREGEIKNISEIFFEI